ncbi:hypothetical protein DVDV_3959 [Desulfovibrio sp. DV]|nr:hypothetical protein DVDV_3959 [Desulfovibrio sp. DV]
MLAAKRQRPPAVRDAGGRPAAVVTGKAPEASLAGTPQAVYGPM